MSKSIEFPISVSMRDCSGGQMSGVDDAFIPDNAARLSIGFRYSKIGCATQRLGYTRLGAAVANTYSNDGIAGFTNSSGSVNRVVANYNGNDYAYNFTSWTSLGSGTTGGTRVRYASFLNLLFRVGGGAATKSWDGNTANPFGTAQLTGAPTGTLVLPYKSKLYIAGDTTFPDRLYFSTIPSLSGNITWDVSTQYLDVNPMDGDNITALAKTGTQMLIFKHNFIYRWNGSSTDAEPVINVGTLSQECVANVKGSVVFFNSKGVFLTDGGLPVEISRPIKNIIDAIPASSYPSICTYAQGSLFGLFVGNVTLEGRMFYNLVLEFDTDTQVWQPHTLASPFRAFANAKASDGGDILVGGAITYVQNMFVGYTDDGSPINFERETRRMEFDSLHTLKEVTDVAFYLTNCPSAAFSAIPIDHTGFPGAAVQFETSVNAISTSRSRSVKGNAISFRISGSNRGAPAVWRGFDILGGRSYGFVNRT